MDVSPPAYVVYFSNLKYVLRSHHFDASVVHRVSHAYLKHLGRFSVSSPLDTFLSFCLQSPPNKMSPLAEIIGWHKAASYCYSVVRHVNSLPPSTKSQKLLNTNTSTKNLQISRSLGDVRCSDQVRIVTTSTQSTNCAINDSPQLAEKAVQTDSEVRINVEPLQVLAEPVVKIDRRRSLSPGEKLLIANLKDSQDAMLPPEPTTVPSTKRKIAKRRKPKSSASSIASSTAPPRTKFIACASDSDLESENNYTIPPGVSSYERREKARALVRTFNEQLGEVQTYCRYEKPWCELSTSQLKKQYGKSKYDQDWFERYHVYPAAWKEFLGRPPPDIDGLYQLSLSNIMNDQQAYGHIAADEKPRSRKK